MQAFQILIDGFAISALYALGATGFTLIFGVSGVLNLSHGAIMVLAAVAAWAAASVLHMNTYAGALVGVLLVARARRFLSEQQMLSAALWWVAAVAGLGALFPSRLMQAFVAFAVGVAGAVAKPSFDALVQRHVREADQGRAFARFETQLQLMWVLGAFAPVVLSLPFAGGDAIMGIAAALGAISYLSSRRTQGTQGSAATGSQ